jgi:hypothetical protein
VVNKDGKHMTLPPLWWLASTVLGIAAAVAAITVVPAWLGTRRPAAEVLQSELARPRRREIALSRRRPAG